MATRRVAPAAQPGVNFGDPGMYVSGGGLPEGDYALEFNLQMYQAQTQQGVSRGPARLGVMVTAYNLKDGNDPAKDQFYSMGSNADKSFAPNASGKGLAVVPGAPGTTLNNQTNWMFLLKSLWDSGMPPEVFTNDLSVLDGIHVHMIQVPEPEERKGFVSQTGEAAGEPRRENRISIVSEIKDDGKPWEGTGGIPQAGAPAPAKPAVPVKKVTPIARVAAPAPAPEPAAEATDEDVQAAASSGVTDVLTANASGCPKLKLRTATFTAVTKTFGEAMAQAVIETYFGSDDALNTILGPLGYTAAAGQVKPS